MDEIEKMNRENGWSLAMIGLAAFALFLMYRKNGSAITTNGSTSIGVRA